MLTPHNISSPSQRRIAQLRPAVADHPLVLSTQSKRVPGASHWFFRPLQMTPRGVQLWLGRGGAPHVRDTLVMANLGYFQLQAGPGAWTLHLAPGAAASTTIYCPSSIL